MAKIHCVWTIRASTVLALGLAVSLAGCAVGPRLSTSGDDLARRIQRGRSLDDGESRRDRQQSTLVGSLRGLTVERVGFTDEANAANQNIQQAQAQYRQARAAADAARAAFWPTVGLTCLRSVCTWPVRWEARGGQCLYRHRGCAWEPDIWGSVRRSVEASDAATQASAAELAAARLSIQVSVAQDYLQLRAADRERDLYARTLVASNTRCA